MSEMMESVNNSRSPTLVPQTPSIADSESVQEHPLDDIDPLDEENLRLQRLWDSQMEDKGGNGLPNRKTVALLLTWHPSIDELNVQEEVASLEEVLRDTYNYKVLKECIEPGKPAETQVRKYLADLVYHYDAKDTLLIVYYAGHGTKGKPGELILEGEKPTSFKTRSLKMHQILWHEAEVNIKNTLGDVFVIFDCCYAGNLILEGRGISTSRNFEFMGATDSKSITSIPGKESFTSALIWALGEFAKKRAPFTINDLQNKISQEAPFFPRKQAPVIASRYIKPHPVRTHLVLAIDSKDGECNTTVFPPKDQEPSHIKETIDLRICFVKHPDDEDIESLARIFKEWIGNNEDTAQRVQWLRLRTPELLVQQYALRWRQLSRAGKKSWKPKLRISTAAHSPTSFLTPPGTLPRDRIDASLETVESPDSVTSNSAFPDSPGTRKFYEERRLFSVSQQEKRALTIRGKENDEGLIHHIFAIVKISRDLLRQPEFRWTSMVVMFGISFLLLRLSLPRHFEFLIVPVRIFNITGS